jgi:two-component system, chemotaxis family, chemotaxis protein CheY
MAFVGDFRRLPILVVDDYQSMRRLIRTLLIQIGFANIDFASDGGAALMKLRDRPYGLIISDLKMQPMSGLRLLREVRNDDRLSAIPFIMVTAAADVDEVIAAKTAGVSDYIVKPFTTDVLQRKIAGVLEHAPGAGGLLASG